MVKNSCITLAFLVKESERLVLSLQLLEYTFQHVSWAPLSLVKAIFLRGYAQLINEVQIIHDKFSNL
jgi:hypothetical protein